MDCLGSQFEFDIHIHKYDTYKSTQSQLLLSPTFIINSFLKFCHVITLRWQIYYSISSTWLMMMLKKIMLIGDVDDAIFWWIKIYCSISLALKRFRDLCTLVTTLSAVNPEYFLRPKFNHTLRVTHTLTTLIENGLRPHLMSNSL